MGILKRLCIGSLALLFAMTATATVFGTTGNRPYGIAIDASGNVYTTNNSSNNVSKITPDGTSTILGTTGEDPVGIAIDASGNVYTANNRSNNVSKIILPSQPVPTLPQYGLFLVGGLIGLFGLRQLRA